MPKGIFKRKIGRKYKTKPKQYPIEDWAKFYNTGVSIVDVGKHFKVSVHVITRELNKLGIVRTRKRNNAEDFFKSISKNPNNDCWEWNKYINNKGYGTFCINKQHIPSHRYSYEIFIGDPSGFEVCHKCDNPKCVNPSHLFLGTHSDNMRDRSLKGRGNDKLTPQKVIEIRNMYEQGIETSAIAKIYSMNRRSIRSIRTKETWSYVK